MIRDGQRAELLAPAGNFQTALAAFAAGADAVYCGLGDFSARAFADNFTFGDLKNLLRHARKPLARPSASSPRSGKVYVTFNTLVDEDNLENAIDRLARLDEIRPDALIVQDLGVARLCRRFFPSLELHASTQLVAHNLEGVLALKELGFRRVVLARELSLAEIASIARRCGDLELEVFIHGALCYSLSGLCLFGAMEKGRSGNRGKCPYCCREGRETERKGAGRESGFAYPFSMKDLRLGEDVLRLVDAGVASLKIEGRMKTALYVASATKYYRQILDGAEGAANGGKGRRVTVSDLETVFSRRTTELYLNGRSDPAGRPSVSDLQPSSASPIDSESLGHLGTPIGTVKKVTKDREGLSWLRFHTSRALEKHDGLQFEAMADGRHVGMGIAEMRPAISRHPVFEVAAGTDVEILLPAAGDRNGSDLAKALKPGMRIYCSMSNAVKRLFPTPNYRPSDSAGETEIALSVTLRKDGVSVLAEAIATPGLRGEARIACALEAAKNPEKTCEAVKKAFSKLGETDYSLARLTLADHDRLFVPMSLLNDLRRDLVERLDERRDAIRREKTAAAADAMVLPASGPHEAIRTVKLRPDQKLPAGDWDEVILAVNAKTATSAIRPPVPDPRAPLPRLALPVYTAEPEFNRLRATVKRFLREGCGKWEASDLATLRMLRELGVTDVTADWTLYAFNSQALGLLSELGVRRFVASPENTRENLRFLCESGFDVEFLSQQSTPLFISLTEPAARPDGLAVFRRDGLWITTRPVPRTWDAPGGASARIDLSWDPEEPSGPPAPEGAGRSPECARQDGCRSSSRDRA